MVFTGSRKAVAVALAVGVIVGGGMTVVAPAVASQDASYAATNWKKIWKQKLQKYADKRYYTKKKARKKFATKAELGGYYTKAQSDANYYTKAQSDANYYTKAQTYTKAESDAKYTASQRLYRGTFFAGGNSPAGSLLMSGGSISFPVQFSAAPTTHLIPAGDPLPVGCLGTAAAPDALPGHLCLFETLVQNVTANRGTLASDGNIGSTPFGAGVFAYSTGAGQAAMLGNWAARPIAVVSPASASRADFVSPSRGGLTP
jgi:hypothetical protein